jgi:WD40 repeat protein
MMWHLPELGAPTQIDRQVADLYAVTVHDGIGITVGQDGKLRRWDLRSGARHQAPSRAVTALAVSRDGDLFAGFSDGSIGGWSRSGVLLPTLRLHEGVVWNLVPLRDGRVLSQGRENTIALTDHTGHVRLVRVPLHGWAEPVWVGVRPLAGGQDVIAIATDAQLFGWDGASAELRERKDCGISIGDGGRWRLTGSGFIAVANLERGPSDCQRCRVLPAEAWLVDVEHCRVAWQRLGADIDTFAPSPDHRLVVIARKCGVEVARLDDGKLVARLAMSDRIRLLSVSPDSRYAAGIDRAQRLIVWELATGRRALDETVLPGAGPATALLWTPLALFVGTERGTVLEIDVRGLASSLVTPAETRDCRYFDNFDREPRFQNAPSLGAGDVDRP